MPTIMSDQLNRITATARNKVVTKRGKAIAIDRAARPFTNWLQKRKKKTSITGEGGKLLEHLKTKGGSTMQTWSGDATMQNASAINNAMLIETEYANFFMNTKFVHDELKKMGYTIVPNQGGNNIQSRISPMSGSEADRIFEYVTEAIETLHDDFDYELDLALHKQGTASSDIVGLNGLTPIANDGTYSGWERAKNPVLQHVVFAGEDANGTAPAYMGKRGVVGASGTLLTQMEAWYRQMVKNIGQSRLTGGRHMFFAGSGFIDKYKSELRRLGITHNRPADGGGKIDMAILDQDVWWGRHPIVYDPTLDELDTVASAEVGLGLSQISCTFGSPASGSDVAKGVAYVTSGGALSAVVVTHRGSGYTSAPTVTLGNVGGGSGATTQAYIYAASSGTGKVEVEADDARIGQVAYVAVTAAGSGYPTTGLAAPFADRLYGLYEPAWELRYQDGMDQVMSVPPDDPRARATEVQMDATYYLRNRFPRASGIIVAATS